MLYPPPSNGPNLRFHGVHGSVCAGSLLRRRAAKQRLGAKLVTNTEAKVEHSMHAGSVSSIQLAGKPTFGACVMSSMLMLAYTSESESPMNGSGAIRRA